MTATIETIKSDIANSLKATEHALLYMDTDSVYSEIIGEAVTASRDACYTHGAAIEEVNVNASLPTKRDLQNLGFAAMDTMRTLSWVDDGPADLEAADAALVEVMARAMQALVGVRAARKTEKLQSECLALAAALHALEGGSEA